MKRHLIALLFCAALCCFQHSSSAGWLPLAKSAGGGGSVTVDAKSATVTTCTTSPCTVNLTLGGTATGVAILFNGTPSVPPTGLAATWNGVAMTAIPNTTSGTNGGCTCWTAAYG
jgi:hypothetical protein